MFYELLQKQKMCQRLSKDFTILRQKRLIFVWKMTIIDLQNGTISARYHFGVFSLGFHRRNGRKYHLDKRKEEPESSGSSWKCLFYLT